MKAKIGAFINVRAEPGTSLLKAMWCRWAHIGDRHTSGWPAAGKMLLHDVACFRCGARYEVRRPNNPRYCHSGPFGKPDISRAEGWSAELDYLETK